METLEQRVAKRGMRRRWKEAFIEMIKNLVFVMPLVLALVLYLVGRFPEAIFWPIMTTVGYQVYVS